VTMQRTFFALTIFTPVFAARAALAAAAESEYQRTSNMTTFSPEVNQGVSRQPRNYRTTLHRREATRT
jgi:hypothetical protein